MAGTPIAPESRKRILDLWAAGARNRSAIARRAGVNRATVRAVLIVEGLVDADTLAPTDAAPAPAQVEATQPQPQPARKGAPVCVYEEGEDAARIEVASDTRIRTLEDAIRHAEVDTTVWRVDRWECVSWEVGMKLRSFDRGKVTGEEPVTRGLWRVKVYLKRIMPRPVHEAVEAVFARMREHAPAYPRVKPRQPPETPHLLEVDLYDCHFGKLAWAPETGQSYDLKIAERVFRNAVADLLDCVANYAIDEVVLPIGNDFFHIDNAANTTTAGTPQDVDGRLPKIYEAGFEAVIWAVEYLMAVAPVRVLWIPGNHDHTTSYFLAHAVSVWFRNSDRVSVDCSPRSRKYHRYGNCLIGYTHGNEEPVKSLPGLMAQERRQEWGETEHKEWRRGHWHKSKVEMTVPVDTFDGVVVRTLRSLSAIDSWHYKRGLGGPRAAECYLMCRETGYRGHFNVNARED